MVGVYRIVNGDKVYVGKSHNLDKRLREHKRMLRDGVHINGKLQSDWDKGNRGFRFEVLESWDVSGIVVNDLRLDIFLLLRERYYMGKYDSLVRGYNIENTLWEILRGSRSTYDRFRDERVLAYIREHLWVCKAESVGDDEFLQLVRSKYDYSDLDVVEFKDWSEIRESLDGVGLVHKDGYGVKCLVWNRRKVRMPNNVKWDCMPECEEIRLVLNGVVPDGVRKIVIGDKVWDLVLNVDYLVTSDMRLIYKYRGICRRFYLYVG